VSPPRVRLEDVEGLWDEGVRRLRGADPGVRGALDAVLDALAGELRRRLGASYTADELAAYYLEHGTDWCLELAMHIAPGTPEAWDLTTVAGAAFARVLRSASDYGGGRRLAAPGAEEE
jgi:hypothetical protein